MVHDTIPDGETRCRWSIWRSATTAARTSRLLASGSLLVVGFWLSVADGPAQAASNDPSAKQQARAEHLAELIDQLGSPVYAQREKARADLRGLGPLAFDALHKAQSHPDVEVRKHAEYLVRALRVSLVQDDDTPEVRQILKNYRSENPEERASRLQRLALLEQGAGLEALCRLVRFEVSDNLSKQAALLVMEMAKQADSQTAKRYADVIRQVIGASDRGGAQWLRVYLASLNDLDGALAQWQQLATQEIEQFRQRPDKVRLVLLRDFLRWQVDLLEQTGHHDLASDLMQQTLELQNASRSDLLESFDWLIRREAWTLIDDLAAQYDKIIQSDPHLLYRLAEAEKIQDRQDIAEQLAARARAIDLPDEPFSHVEVGRDLHARGLIDWAEQEYRRAIELGPEDSHAAIQATIALAWMYHDQGRHRDGYEILRPLVAKLAENDAVQRKVRELQQDVRRIRGQMHFAHALYLAETNETEQQVKQLQEAIKYDPDNADILIAMYRVKDPPTSWQRMTSQRIARAVSQYRSQVMLAERNYQTVPSAESRRYLALRLNQFAWLVANTEGDYRGALEASQRSVQLIGEDAGYLDTLARCYFAVKDYANALKYQRRAVQLEPHSGQIRRQLALFESLVDQANHAD